MKNISIKDMILAGMFAALIGIMGYVSIPIPISPVPISGQTLVIMIIGLLLTPKQAFYSVATWILVGVAGAPVFSGGRAGISVLASPSGGYIIGFLAGAVAISMLKGRSISMGKMYFSAIIGGILVVYACGVPVMAYLLNMDMMTALKAGAVPFLIGDLIKVLISVNLAYTLRGRLERLVHA
ncbi:MAG: biotin transporter BioY [Clostridia bacterium]|nr:biotin transporter BioY [Clostridia bacterium]